jgi:hypothetical protein
MSSSGWDSGGASTTSEEGVVAGYETWFVVGALSVGAIALILEMSPIPAEEAASKHSALVYVVCITVAPRTLRVLARRFSSFGVDDLANARLYDCVGKSSIGGYFSEHAGHQS